MISEVADTFQERYDDIRRAKAKAKADMASLQADMIAWYNANCEELRALRKKLGRTQGEACALLRLNHVIEMCMVERGNAIKVGPRVLVLLAKVYAVLEAIKWGTKSVETS